MLLFSLLEIEQLESDLYDDFATRKKLMIMLEKSMNATAIIGKTGNIFFYNKEFKSLCLDKPPENIFKLFKGDERSTEQLMKLIQT